MENLFIENFQVFVPLFQQILHFLLHFTQRFLFLNDQTDKGRAFLRVEYFNFLEGDAERELNGKFY